MTRNCKFYKNCKYTFKDENCCRGDEKAISDVSCLQFYFKTKRKQIDEKALLIKVNDGLFWMESSLTAIKNFNYGEAKNHLEAAINIFRDIKR